MAADPDVYFETDHYKGWPAILVRVSMVTVTDLAQRIATAWRMQAPRRLVAQIDAEN